MIYCKWFATPELVLSSSMKEHWSGQTVVIVFQHKHLHIYLQWAMLYISYIAGQFVCYLFHYMSKLSRNIIEFLLLNGSKPKANQILYPKTFERDKVTLLGPFNTKCFVSLPSLFYWILTQLHINFVNNSLPQISGNWVNIIPALTMASVFGQKENEGG